MDQLTATQRSLLDSMASGALTYSAEVGWEFASEPGAPAPGFVHGHMRRLQDCGCLVREVGGQFAVARQHGKVGG